MRIVKLGIFALLLVSVHANSAQVVARGNGNLPPYGYFEDGAATGIVHDLAEALFQVQGIDVDIILGPWGEQQALVKGGEGEVLLHINPTPARLDWLAFSDAFINSEIAIFYRDDQFLHALSDLNGLTVGVEAKGYPIQVLQAETTAEVFLLDSWKSGFELVSKGELDAILVDRWVGEYLISQLDLTNITASTAGFAQSFSRIAVPAGEVELLASINQGLHEIRRNGTYNEIMNKWSGDRVVFTTLAEKRLSLYLKYAVGVIGLLFVLLLFYVRKLKAAKRVVLNHAATLQNQVDRKTKDLQLAAERQREMFAVIGHELRTPIATISMLSKDRKMKNDEKVGLISELVVSLLNVLEDLRIVVAPERIRKTSIEYVSPCDVIKRALGPFTTLLGSKGIQLHLDLKNCDRVCEVNAQALRQIVTNLVKNSAVHSDGKNIWISFEIIESEPMLWSARMSVTDDGVGLPEELQNRLFQAFSKGSSSIEGTGLGLYICKELATLLNGEITFSQRDSTGAQFNVEMHLPLVPLQSGNKAKGRETASAKLQTGHLSGQRVLLAEDEKMLRMLTERILTNAGASVSSAVDGAQALEIYDSNQFDIIITDIMMPEVNGYELASGLRERGFNGPIIGVTAAVVGSETDELIQAGADSVLAKPLNLEELEEALSQFFPIRFMRSVDGVTSGSDV